MRTSWNPVEGNMDWEFKEILEKFGWELNDELLYRYQTDILVRNLMDALVTTHVMYKRLEVKCQTTSQP